MLNVEQLKKRIHEEYETIVEIAATKRDERLGALAILGDVYQNMPVRRNGTRNGMANAIRKWVRNGAPNEFTSNDIADAIKRPRPDVQIAAHGLCRQGDIQKIRTESSPMQPMRHYVYGKGKGLAR